ncbi:MAG: hypothetical protein NUW12_06950 [Firmicutes bacterium]|nr:hypothetical protein [Bacillota bacterium]MDH7495887.1 hypothetical protein [Bacillota bacterium]
MNARDEQIDEIMRFVAEHKESQAARAICGRILGRYDMEVGSESLRELRDGLEKASDEEVESLYYIVR